MDTTAYSKASKYSDLDAIYAQCNGPGGLKLAEFMAKKMGLQSNKRLLDVGTNRGYQSCFLAKEYGVFVVGIDPWPEICGPKLWKGQHHVAQISLGIDDERRDAIDRSLFQERDTEPCLPTPRHAHTHAMSGQILGIIEKKILFCAPLIQIINPSQVKCT